MPKLLISLPESSDASHDLTEPVITIGRVPDSVLQIEDISVSSNHATLTLGEDGDYILRDIGSTNGTMLNGKDIVAEEDHKLQDGDKITFGKIETSYVSENPAEARPLPETEEVTAVVASTSKRPADFANASPFQKKKKKKDPVGLALIVVAILAILGFGAVVASVYNIQPPTL
ncbi:MAG: FHA domain-containing protein [Chthoniobacter sp.]|uniref:FHA domain-containing protein n=1 Tax=Chthoniobacter sp. TaxID=2510640 RepID=UPI0032A8D129